MARLRAAIVTVATLAAATLVVSSLPSRPAPQASARPPAASPTAARNLLTSTAGFDVEVPPGWLGVVDDRQTNRSIYRRLLLGNRGLEAPDVAISSWPWVPSDRLIVELVEYFGPPALSSRNPTESAFPLDWQQAQELAPDGIFTARSLSFRHVGRTFGLRVHIGPDAPSADVARLPALVASIRPEPIPTSGVYRGWRVLGPLDAYPVGTVTHFDPIAPNVYGFFLVRGRTTTFAHLDRAHMFYGGMKPCDLRYDASTRTFVCDRSGDRWSRVGKPLTGAEHFGLAFQQVLVKDGLVLVGGGMSGARIQEDDSAEFSDPAAVPLWTVPFSRSGILARFATITSVEPIERSAAKLVSTEALARTQLFAGATMPAGNVWVVAVGNSVQWTFFAADPLSGGVLSWRCCDGGAWLEVFDGLRDQAPPS